MAGGVTSPPGSGGPGGSGGGIKPPPPSTIDTGVPPMIKGAFPGIGEVDDLGVNWRIKFADADGIPLNMLSFETIDFGAIAYKEIFQNVKTILATPVFSAALERLLGVDASIVDRPIDNASEATIAILDAIYYWEPRAEVVSVLFDADVVAGHLICNVQLKIKDVIFGTDIPYNKNSIFKTPPVVQTLPPPTTKPPDGGDVIYVEGPPGPEGPQGPTGPTGQRGVRGSVWFTGASDPAPNVAGAQPQDMYLNTTTAAIFQFDGTQWRMVFNGMAT